MLRKGIAIVLILINLLSLSGASLAAGETVGYVTSTGLYIRTSPSTKAKALRCAKNGEKLVILKEEGDWYYVKYNEVVSGYVAKAYVSKQKTSTSSASTTTQSVQKEVLPDKISGLGQAPATSRVGDRGDDVKKLQQALKILGYYSGKSDGIFGKETESAVKRFQKSRGLSQDGIAGKGTIRTLFGQEAANASSSSASKSSSTSDTPQATKTEVLNWYKDSVSSVIPRGTHVTVKDVKTGKTFRAKHLFGSSHMDAEPLTKEDTAKMKAIYGGSWSWDRRAILILCSGRVFAASMNGMPHGEQSIYDNDFDGQFCIHFLGSKTHGSDKVDADHQYCITVAGRSSW